MRAEEIIATHTNTDFDAFASMLAVRRLYPNAVICLAGSLNRNVRDFYRLRADELSAVEAARMELGSVRRLIVVETVHAGRLAELEPLARDPRVEKLVFDHHAGELPDWAEPDKVVLSADGALTTTLAGILAERAIAITPLEATVFALGIHEDTGSLTYPSTTQRDAEALAWCLRHGASQETVSGFLHTPLRDDDRRLLNALLEALESHRAGGVEVLVAAVAWPQYVDGISNLAHKLVDLTDCAALVVLVEMGGRVFAVTRSRSEFLDAGAVAAALGGGGHPQAASAILRGTLAEARTAALAALEAAVRQPLRARDVMARPARSTGPDTSVRQAMVACQRHHQSGLLVLEGGRLAGSVSREDLDKAIAHGLSHAPVKAVMSGHVPTADEDAPLPELQRLLASAREGRVAILAGERVTGVVTRRELLRALGEPVPAAEATGPSIAPRLRALARLEQVFRCVAAVGETFEGVFLVGGTVRDIFLGEEGFDVDVAVEGDAIRFGRLLARELGGRVTAHEKFGTAVVSYGDGERIDVVTARTEFYEAPAALPTVEHSTIEDDLRRRDFTINAMAVSLKGDDFGRLIDPFGGRADLEARPGRIRVLHNLSFIDDPTRIFRAIRYENRYAFRMDAHTERLARSCVEMGLVGDLSSERLRNELELLLGERDVGHSILRLAELGAARTIHPRLAADEETVALIARLRALADEYALDVPAWRLGLAALARPLAPDEVYAWLERLRVRRVDAERIAAAVTVGPVLAERLGAASTAPSEIVRLADAMAPDAALFALGLAELPALRRYFAELRFVDLDITGDDLVGLGLPESPEVGEVLGELRRRKLDGELAGRDSELEAARELIAAR